MCLQDVQEPPFRLLPTPLDNSLVADLFLVSEHRLPAPPDQHTLSSWLTQATVARWLECTTTVSLFLNTHLWINADIDIVWWVGNIIAGWTTYGTDKNFPGSSWAWRLPTVIQCVMPAIVMAFVLFFPGKSTHCANIDDLGTNLKQNLLVGSS